MRASPLPLGAFLRLAEAAALFGSLLVGAQPAGAAGGGPERGAEVFRACAACHALTSGEHRTGPSLAGIFGREAGTIPGFTRYSQALEEAEVTWTEETLDPWLANPQAMIPGNRMTFRGIGDAQTRADLIAFLEVATAEAARADDGNASPDLPDLGTLGPDRQVAAIRYCGDTYEVTTAAGETIPFWEFNLRFKTDSSDKGPRPGQPALLPASMMGDRAFVIFADPAEISTAIEKRC
ncbi:MAG: c-type cytochrome [Candidatus Limnocylindria bacterium]